MQNVPFTEMARQVLELRLLQVHFRVRGDERSAFGRDGVLGRLVLLSWFSPRLLTALQRPLRICEFLARPIARTTVCNGVQSAGSVCPAVSLGQHCEKFQQMKCNDRVLCCVVQLSFGPTTPNWQHVKVLGLLIVVQLCCGFLTAICVLVSFHAGANTFAFMVAEVRTHTHCSLVQVSRMRNSQRERAAILFVVK